MSLTRPLLALALTLPTVALLPAMPAAAACTVTVSLPNYSPATVTITPGSSVTWCWSSGPHSVTGNGFDYPPGCTPSGAGCANQGAQFTHTFASTGSFSYVCRVHSSMHGTVVVKQAATTTPSPTKTATPSPTPAKTSAPAATRTPSPTPSRTPSRTPTPTPTTASPTTPPPTTSPPAVAPTTISATPLVLDPAPAKPKTGLAIALGLVVAAGALGGAVWLFLRGRTA